MREHSLGLAHICNALKPCGIALLQMGETGNAATFLKIIDQMIESENWQELFLDFKFPFGFYEADE